MNEAEPRLLPGDLDPGEHVRAKLERDYRNLAREEAIDLPRITFSEYGVDLAARLGGLEIPHPFGKGSGQLSLQAEQVAADVRAGLAFTVLKTVIAESPAGASRMSAWKVPVSRMLTEEIVSRSGRKGWTVSWVGRGWDRGLEEYAAFLSASLRVARGSALRVIPSAKFHLPGTPGESYDTAEYEHTLAVLSRAWREGGGEGPLLLEKDFSPTLAGSPLAEERGRILAWIDEVPALVRRHAPAEVRLGLKLMNAVGPETLQTEMLHRAAAVQPALEFVTCFNRLFDPDREIDGRKGIAYGGYDLSDRNLRALEVFATEGGRASVSATGNIASGRLMAEYALRGATSGQIHTFFQLPRSAYISSLPRSRAALHELILHPREGLIAALAHVRRRIVGSPEGSIIRFLDLPEVGRRLLDDLAGR